MVQEKERERKRDREAISAVDGIAFALNQAKPPLKFHNSSLVV